MLGSTIKGAFKLIRNKIVEKQGTLSYLEINITEHCNLSCKSCSHFSPLANDWYYRIDEMADDLNQLRKIFPEIRTIRLLGGEPLMHPQIKDFIKCTRTFYPTSQIYIATNGVLLEKMNPSFWKTCAANKIRLALTIYPPYQKVYKRWLDLCKFNQIPYKTVMVSHFRNPFIDLTGKSKITESFKKCPMKGCHTLKNGKLYVCPTSALSIHFNEYFNVNIPSSYSVNLYQNNHDPVSIIRTLNTPLKTCAYCSWNNKKNLWEFSKHKIEEWLEKV